MIAEVVASWIRYLAVTEQTNIIDPQASELQSRAQNVDNDTTLVSEFVAEFLNPDAAAGAAFIAQVEAAYVQIRQDGATSLLSRYA